MASQTEDGLDKVLKNEFNLNQKFMLIMLID